MKALVEKRNELEAKSQQLSEIFEQAGEDLDLSKAERLKDLADSKARAEKVKALHDEIDALGAEVQELASVEDIAAKAKAARDEQAGIKRPAQPTDPAKGKVEREFKSLGQLVAESEAIKGYTGGGRGPLATLQVENLKTLMTTSAGFAPETTRTGRVVDFATRPIQIIDVMPMGNTGQSAVVYMEETTYTNAAAEVAEGNEKPESALAFTERSEPVRKVATILPVTDEQLDDVPGIQSFIDNRLRFMVRQRLDSQILTGNGTPPNLEGILERSIQTQSAVDMPLVNAVRRAMTKVRVTGRAVPTAFVVNPLDWDEVVLMRTSDGIYIWGHPSAPGPATIWGLPVVESDAIPEGSGLVGDFAAHSELTMRQDIDVQVSNSHEDYFAFNKQAIRAELRAAVVVYRPTAFCEIDDIGITS